MRDASIIDAAKGPVCHSLRAIDCSSTLSIVSLLRKPLGISALLLYPTTLALYHLSKTNGLASQDC
jgi:hypothetical protein